MMKIDTYAMATARLLLALLLCISCVNSKTCFEQRQDVLTCIHTRGDWVAHKIPIEYKIPADIEKQSPNQIVWGRCDIEPPPWVWNVDSSCDPTHPVPRRAYEQTSICSIMKGRNIMIVGDSINNQFFLSFVSYMWPYNMPFNKNKDIIPLSGAFLGASAEKDSNNAIGVTVPCDGVPGVPDFSIYFVRNYNLTTNTKVLLEYNQTKETRLNQPRAWTGQLKCRNISFVLMNRGAHWKPDDDVMRDVDNAFTYMKRHHPNVKVFYRSTPYGHINCDYYKGMGPGSWHTAGHNIPYHWGEFSRQNEKVFNLIKAKHPQVGYLDFANSTSIRSDSHIGNGDCLHYCLPGPIDNWTKMLIASIKVTDYMNCSAPLPAVPSVGAPAKQKTRTLNVPPTKT